MGMGCGMSMIKYVLFIFNLLCALCGIALLVIGVVFYLQVNDYKDLVQNHNIGWTPLALIILGAIIFIIAFFGCCGAIRESHCLTLSYSVCLFILIVVQIIIGAMILANKDEISKQIQTIFKDNVWARRTEPANAKLLDIMQKNLECCGLNSFADWAYSGVLDTVSNFASTLSFNNVAKNLQNSAYPESCCATQISNGVCAPYQTGCFPAVKNLINNGGNLLGFVLLGVAAVELVGFIFACCLANSIRNQERRYA